LKERLPSYGGQAVLEGVMMRGARVCSIAVRAPDQSIVVQTMPLARFYQSRMARIPFVRGLLMLWDALVLGVRALTFSADVQMGEEQKLEAAPMAVTMILAVAFGIGLFFLLPAGIGYLSERLFGWGAWWANFLEGIVRLLLLVGYVWAVGLWSEVRRVYRYHGAEHKTINAFEAGAPLTAASVAAFPREHPRCGTAFLLTVAVFSILLFGALGPLPLLPRLVSRVILIPVLASLAYEYIRLSAKWMAHPWGRALAAPNLALQRITTQEPDLGMIEVAIAAFEGMRQAEQMASPAGSH
jgi:uncharacterized protein YqhQ